MLADYLFGTMTEFIRDQEEQRRAPEVAGDEDHAAREAIDDRACDEADKEEGEEVGEIEQRDLEGACIEETDRNDR